MKPVARTLQDLVGGKAIIVGPGEPTVIVNNKPVSVVGDIVASHGQNEHAAAVIVTGSSTVYAGNKPITIVTSTASCGESVTIGSPDVMAS
jgi:uncharacterized Zn-binding protein involved in type VI secretion